MANKNLKKSTNKTSDRYPARGELMRFETSAGVLKIKKFSVSTGFLRKNRKESEIELMFLLIEQHSDEAALEIIDALPLEETTELFNEWQEKSGALLGES